VADSTKSGTVTITLQPGVSVVAKPFFFDVTAVETQKLTAAVLGTSDQRVTYSLLTPIGTLSSSGTYTPPSFIAQQTIIQVLATSVAAPSRSALIIGILQP
jgi:hypothetical protein